MIFKPFKQQRAFLLSKARIKAALSGRRGGKTEVGAVEAIIHTEQKIGYKQSEVDPYIGVIIAPTTDMLRRLSLMKFLAYAKPFNYTMNKSNHEIKWPNGSVVYGISGDKPERLEGIKANFIWIDESFQVPEQLFIEAMARVADTQGKIWITGSLGVQYNNPKAHWIYKHFKQKPLEGSECFEWATAQNPYFPQEEAERLKDTLDPVTYRQMFELSWDVQGTNLVYEDFSESNLITNYKYNPALPTYVSVDWGWTHPAAVLYFQYNPHTDVVYLFDEIHASKMTLEVMFEKMSAKPYRVNEYYCDIAGLQTREQTAISNIQWFKQAPRNIHFKYRTSAVTHGISLVRSYIKNMKGQTRLYIDSQACPKTIDEMRNYSYKERNGEITETPNADGEDALSALRYFFVNRLDYTKPKDSFTEFNRWKLTGG